MIRLENYWNWLEFCLLEESGTKVYFSWSRYSWVKIYLMKIALKRCDKLGYFMYNKPDWLYIWLISEKWRNLETPFACRLTYYYVLFEGEFKEASVERRTCHLYSLVCKAGTRSSIGYMNRMLWRSTTLVWRKSSQSQVPEYKNLQLSVNFVQVGEFECCKVT